MTDTTHPSHPTNTTHVREAQVDAELKQRTAQLWALGDYGQVAATAIPTLGATLVQAAGVAAGERVLDVAAGTGNVAVPAARLGAEVTAIDLTPELVTQGRRAAPELAISWQVGDAEALPFEADSFDVVLSCVGVMFAPHHQQTADELARVCRSGGRVAVLSWTPEGFIGEMFATMKPYAPAPPPGAMPPPLWGSEAHVTELFADTLTQLRLERGALTVPVFDSGAAFRDFFKANYGPTIATYRAIADTPGRTADLDAALAALGERALAEGRPMEWEYLIALGTAR